MNVNDIVDPVRDNQRPMSIIELEDMIESTFLTEPKEDGTRTRLRINEQLDSLKNALNTTPAMLRFRAVNSDEIVQEIILFNQLVDKIEDNDGAED